MTLTVTAAYAGQVLKLFHATTDPSDGCLCTTASTVANSMKATNRIFGVTQHYIEALLVKPRGVVVYAPEQVLDTELMLPPSDASRVGEDDD